MIKIASYVRYNLKIKNTKNGPWPAVDEFLREKDLINYVFEPFEYSKDHCFVYHFYEFVRWADCVNTMIEASKKFPDLVFILDGESEEKNVIWREYYKNGRYEHCRGKYVFDEPKRITC